MTKLGVVARNADLFGNSRHSLALTGKLSPDVYSEISREAPSPSSRQYLGYYFPDGRPPRDGESLPTIMTFPTMPAAIWMDPR
jgi:hypothetical protein